MGRASAQQQQYLQDLKDLYVNYKNAIMKLSSRIEKEYTIGDRTFEFKDTAEIQSLMDDVNAKICKLEAGNGVRYQSVVPLQNS